MRKRTVCTSEFNIQVLAIVLKYKDMIVEFVDCFGVNVVKKINKKNFTLYCSQVLESDTMSQRIIEMKGFRKIKL